MFSLFGLARLGSSFSVWDYLTIGSSISVKDFTRCGSSVSVASDVRVGGQVQFQGSSTYINFVSGSDLLEVYVNSARSATFESDGGILHGTWTVSATPTTSDRRLKKDIVPLRKTLRGALSQGDQLVPAVKKDLKGSEAGGNEFIRGEQPGDGALWLLRQLRPVSYSFRKGAESKHMRFGFVADELESVVPQVVRNMGNREVPDQKAVVYQDLIALLTAALQEQQRTLRDQQLEMQDHQRSLQTLTSRYDELLSDLDALKEADEILSMKRSKGRKRQAASKEKRRQLRSKVQLEQIV